jgi:putative transcriptional regulator
VSSLKGRLLVATPALFDPNFRRTVVLVGEHGEEGAMGLVLNRPSDLTVSEAVPPLAAVVGAEERVHVGGPVQPEAVLVLADFEETADAAAAAMVVGNIGFASSEGDLEQLAGLVRRARVFAGYSGWGPGQLEAELEEESWLVEPGEAVDLFPAAGDDLFGSVLRRKGGTYRVLALMPEDPSAN